MAEKIIISGANLAGLSCALALAQQGIGSYLIDPILAKPVIHEARTTALNAGSIRFYNKLGLGDMLRTHSAPIKTIAIAAGKNPAALQFTPLTTSDEVMGYIVNNHLLRQSLRDALPSSLVTFIPQSVTAITFSQQAANATLDNGTTLSAPLLIGADGANSKIRTHANIPAAQYSYQQSALVFSIAHSQPHHGVAYERFLASGPLASLPLAGQESNIVWSLPSARAAILHQADDASLAQLFMQNFGTSLGEVRVIDQRGLYPLRWLYPEKVTAPRVALVGESAHTMHPLAGQGFNISVRDIACLIDVLQHADDWGSTTTLENYETWRRSDIVSMLLFMNGLNGIFSNNLPVLRGLRQIGLHLTNAVQPLRDTMVRHAMGITGQLPSLLQAS